MELKHTKRVTLLLTGSETGGTCRMMSLQDATQRLFDAVQYLAVELDVLRETIVLIARDSYSKNDVVAIQGTCCKHGHQVCQTCETERSSKGEGNG